MRESAGTTRARARVRSRIGRAVREKFHRARFFFIITPRSHAATPSSAPPSSSPRRSPSCRATAPRSVRRPPRGEQSIKPVIYFRGQFPDRRASSYDPARQRAIAEEGEGRGEGGDNNGWEVRSNRSRNSEFSGICCALVFASGTLINIGRDVSSNGEANYFESIVELADITRMNSPLESRRPFANVVCRAHFVIFIARKDGRARRTTIAEIIRDESVDYPS